MQFFYEVENGRGFGITFSCAGWCKNCMGTTTLEMSGKLYIKRGKWQ